jgi:hypothetical protein
MDMNLLRNHIATVHHVTGQINQRKIRMSNEEYLKSKGWFQWYHKDAWCHHKTTGLGQDCTKSSMSLSEALLQQMKWETKDE